MNILNTHLHYLRFKLDNDAPNEYVERWTELKSDCEYGESGPSEPGPNKLILEVVKAHCILEQNKELPYLNRTEGGLGGGNNKINKQIRFRHNHNYPKDFIMPNDRDNDIVFKEITNTDTEQWTYEELDDLLFAFVKTANEIVEAECVTGVIEMIHKDQSRF